MKQILRFLAFSMPPSSSGQGCQVLSLETGVQIPLGMQDLYGEVAEWFNAMVLKTIEAFFSSQGSNPCLSEVHSF